MRILHTVIQADKWLKRLIPLYLLTLLPQLSIATNFYGYTDERPLVIVCDWDFQPYEFINTDGKPSGYNIEVLNMILDRLEIPHKFVMQEWYVAIETFEHHEADLIHALSSQFQDQAYIKTKNYINYYNLKLARRLDTPPLKSIRNLTANDTILVKKDDYAPFRISQELQPEFTIIYKTPKDGLTSVRRGQSKYYIWGEIPLSKKVKELTLDSIALDEIDIPAGELHMIGYDKDLLDAIDDEFARLDQSGEIEKIYNKWFHPDRIQNDVSTLALLILVGIAIISIIAFLLSHLITLRVKAAVAKSEELNNMMMLALSMGDYFVTEYDILTDRITNRHGSLIPERGITMNEFISHIPPEEQEDIRQFVAQMKNGKEKIFTKQICWNSGTEDAPQWRHLSCTINTEMEDGRPRYVVNTIKDMTQEVLQEQENRELGNKYKKIFETNLLAMSFYDKDGWFLDLNDKMRTLCEFDNDHEKFFRKTNLFENVFFKGDLSHESRDVFYCCMHMNLPEVGLDKYIETHIKPVVNEKGQLTYYVVTSRDVTAERSMYLDQQRHDLQLLEANKITSEYEQQLYYVLEECKMFIWHLDTKTGNIHFTRSLRGSGYDETIEEFFAGICEEEREEAIKKVNDCITNKRPYNTIHRYDYTPVEKGVTWYSISGMPTLDKEGNLIEFFGIARNITDLMIAQKRLKEETSRAEDSGRLKAAFLANMTHEIRTPLNAIVGFRDILQMVDTQEERMEFIRIIRNNCDMLLRLINDILEASSMGQALAIEPAQIDLSQVFDDICQTLEQRVQEPGVQFIKDNPYPTYRAILDKGRLQQVLTNFVTNAVKYTHEGHIKVGYREQDGGIYFYCEDTGAGIPKEKQTAVFERFIKLNDFVQGTGLGLSICKSICERCGGRIGVDSEGEGHGSTFWLWIPREITQKR